VIAWRVHEDEGFFVFVIISEGFFCKLTAKL